MKILIRVLLRSIAVGVVVLAPTAIVPDGHIPQSKYAVDPRLVALTEFLEEKESPISHLAEDFLIVADRHHLDWRLLPSIAFIESSAGKVYRNNNIFGWNNASTPFESVREGIYHVGERLGTSTLYRGKSMKQKLNLYNPFDHYAPAVIRVAERLSRLEAEARTRTATEFRRPGTKRVGPQLPLSQAEAGSRSQRTPSR